MEVLPIELEGQGKACVALVMVWWRGGLMTAEEKRVVIGLVARFTVAFSRWY